MKEVEQKKEINLSNVQISSTIWNSLSGIILAGQSAVILIFVAKFCGLESAGVFTIAYAVANLMLTIGKYGMRNFQVTDVANRFSFREYFWSRIITCIMMLAASLSQVFLGKVKNGYNDEKMIIILLFCILKELEAFEDIYYGHYQKEGRLDIAAKCLTIRLFATTLLLILFVIWTRNLLLSSLWTSVISVIICGILILITYPAFRDKGQTFQFKNLLMLLKECFPLFLCGYLSIYMGNIPKYAIDRHMSSETQACFGFVFMPVFVIGLFSSFAFNPILSKLAFLWDKKNYHEFGQNMRQQICIILLLTVAILFGGAWAGIPILSVVYSTDLTQYKITLLTLLFGGGFYAINMFLTVILTVFRCQTQTVYCFLLTAVVSTIMSDYVVAQYGVNGAAVLYVFTMIFGAIALGIVAVRKYVSSSGQKLSQTIRKK